MQKPKNRPKKLAKPTIPTPPLVRGQKSLSHAQTGLLQGLSPNIHMQILQTVLNTFPLRITWGNLVKDQGIFSLVIMVLILTTLSLDNVWILLGENWCCSLLGLEGLILNFCGASQSLSYRGPWIRPSCEAQKACLITEWGTEKEALSLATGNREFEIPRWWRPRKRHLESEFAFF